MSNLSPEMQTAQDMLNAAVAQRDAYANECVSLAAQVKMRDRRIAELEAQIKAQTADKSEQPVS